MRLKNASLTVEDIVSTKYLLSLLKRVSIATTKIENHKEFKLGFNNYRLFSESEKRDRRLFTMSCNLLNFIKDLKKIWVFLNRTPERNYLEKHEISQLEYIQYHDEVFLHKVHTICELMKLIANEELGLGIKEKDCSWTTLIKYPEFSKAKCSKVIQDYFEFFKDHIDDRHLNTHRGLYDDPTAAEIGTSLFIHSQHKKTDM